MRAMRGRRQGGGVTAGVRCGVRVRVRCMRNVRAGVGCGSGLGARVQGRVGGAYQCEQVVGGRWCRRRATGAPAICWRQQMLLRLLCIRQVVSGLCNGVVRPRQRQARGWLWRASTRCGCVRVRCCAYAGDGCVGCARGAAAARAHRAAGRGQEGHGGDKRWPGRAAWASGRRRGEGVGVCMQCCRPMCVVGARCVRRRLCAGGCACVRVRWRLCAVSRVCVRGWVGKAAARRRRRAAKARQGVGRGGAPWRLAPGVRLTITVSGATVRQVPMARDD